MSVCSNVRAFMCPIALPPNFPFISQDCCCQNAEYLMSSNPIQVIQSLRQKMVSRPLHAASCILQSYRLPVDAPSSDDALVQGTRTRSLCSMESLLLNTECLPTAFLLFCLSRRLISHDARMLSDFEFRPPGISMPYRSMPTVTPSLQKMMR